jgi:hypothetical protein
MTLRIIDVPGSHASMLGLPNRAVLGARLLEALGVRSIAAASGAEADI